MPPDLSGASAPVGSIHRSNAEAETRRPGLLGKCMKPLTISFLIGIDADKPSLVGLLRGTTVPTSISWEAAHARRLIKESVENLLPPCHRAGKADGGAIEPNPESFQKKMVFGRDAEDARAISREILAAAARHSESDGKVFRLIIKTISGFGLPLERLEMEPGALAGIAEALNRAADQFCRGLVNSIIHPVLALRARRVLGPKDNKHASGEREGSQTPSAGDGRSKAA